MTWQEQVLTENQAGQREVDVTTKAGVSVYGRIDRVESGGVWISSGGETIVVDLDAIEDIRFVP
jgi:hypothetical protein